MNNKKYKYMSLLSDWFKLYCCNFKIELRLDFVGPAHKFILCVYSVNEQISSIEEERFGADYLTCEKCKKEFLKNEEVDLFENIYRLSSAEGISRYLEELGFQKLKE